MKYKYRYQVVTYDPRDGGFKEKNDFTNKAAAAQEAKHLAETSFVSAAIFDRKVWAYIRCFGSYRFVFATENGRLETERRERKNDD